MKKLVILSTVLILTLAVGGTALAASLGVSPSHVEIEVLGDGSATADVQVHYFSGDVQVSLVDIPLQIEPEVLNVDALSEPEDVQLTIFGDESLGSQVYDGYIRFMGLSGETVAVAVKIKATITNIVEGQPLPVVAPEPETGTLAESTDVSEEITDVSSAPPPAEESDSSSFLGGIEGLSTNLVIIIAAAVVFLGLVILAISMSRRKKRYY
ncbi:MAG: hypothetical protein PVG61_08235 [Dehalococcoidia bacterium]|jgi:hypothetical protein